MTIGLSKIHRQEQSGLVWTSIRRPGVSELHATLRLQRGEDGPRAAHRLIRLLEDHRASVVRLEVFGDISLCKETLNALRALGGRRVWPVTWVDARDCAGKGLAGMHLMAMSGVEVRPIDLNGVLAGVIVDESRIRHCFFSGLQPDNSSDSRAAQVGRLYERIEQVLVQAGMDLSHLVRTWFFLDSILAWYGDFNEIRNEVYVQRRLLQNLVPASTGIGARNSGQTAAIVGGWAIRSTDPSFSATAVSSPLQCSAPSYGSCFSRAVELRSSDLRRLLISGTASINARGASVGQSDIVAQIELTMRVLQALLEARQMRFADVARATAYLKSASDAQVFASWCEQNQMTGLPVIVTHADVCRDELLFELELDAIVTVGPS